jgi:hypothetical protein
MIKSIQGEFMKNLVFVFSIIAAYFAVDENPVRRARKSQLFMGAGLNKNRQLILERDKASNCRGFNDLL